MIPNVSLTLPSAGFEDSPEMVLEVRFKDFTPNDTAELVKRSFAPLSDPIDVPLTSSNHLATIEAVCLYFVEMQGADTVKALARVRQVFASLAIALAMKQVNSEESKNA